MSCQAADGYHVLKASLVRPKSVCSSAAKGQRKRFLWDLLWFLSPAVRGTCALGFRQVVRGRGPPNLQQGREAAPAWTPPQGPCALSPRPPGAGPVQDAAGQHGGCVPRGPRRPVSALPVLGRGTQGASGRQVRAALQPSRDVDSGQTPQALGRKEWELRPTGASGWAGRRAAGLSARRGAGRRGGLEQQGQAAGATSASGKPGAVTRFGFRSRPLPGAGGGGRGGRGPREQPCWRKRRGFGFLGGLQAGVELDAATWALERAELWS